MQSIQTRRKHPDMAGQQMGEGSQREEGENDGSQTRLLNTIQRASVRGLRQGQAPHQTL